MKKTCRNVFAMTLVLLAVLSGCSGTQNSEISVGSEMGVYARQKVTIGINNEPVMLDPAYAMDSFGSLVILNIHDPLVRRGADGKVYPNLAKSWEISTDGLVYTFVLEEGVKFQNGQELTAEDVVFSLNRSIANPASALYTTPFDHAEVIDDYTVKLINKFPDQATLQYLTGGNNCIVSKAIVENVGEDEYNNFPCGTGPYKLVEWQKGSSLIFERFDEYWRGAPSIKDVELRILKEATTMMVALESGDIDQAYNIQAIDVPTVKASAKLNYRETFGTSIWNIVYNCNLEPFNDVKVRNALSMAINKQDIVDGAADGAGKVGNIILTPETEGNPGEDRINYLKYDPQTAKALLAEAGFPNGFKTVIYVREDFTKKIGSIIQSQWKEIGVEAEVVVMERSALLADSKAGKLTCYTTGNVSITMDASFLLGTLASYNIPASNYTFWSDPEYDALLDQQSRESDPIKRLELITQMLNYEAMVTPRATLYYTTANTAFNKKLNADVYPALEGYYWYNLSWSE